MLVGPYLSWNEMAALLERHGLLTSVMGVACIHAVHTQACKALLLSCIVHTASFAVL